MEIFLDTSFLVAFHNKADKNHNKARRFMADADQKEQRTDVGDQRSEARGEKNLSVEAGRKILEDERIHLLQIDSDIFDKAWLVYRSFDDKLWSFTDCTSYVLMKNLSVDTGASFDNHFDQFGFITVPR